MQTFTLYNFQVNKYQVELVLPQAWQAQGLFEQLQQNRDQFAKYLPWIDDIDSIEKEKQSIKLFQQKMVDGTAFNLVIMVDHQPAGMLDLHELNNEFGEVGYWLGKDFQHVGIMTKSVDFLIKYAFQELVLDYLLLRVRPHNFASQSVATRVGFSYLEDDENGFKVYILKK